MRKETAKYLISDTFKITGRGLILSGYITEGSISIGDTIEFTALNYLFQRKIIGIEGITFSQPKRVNTGLLIKCKNDEEIDELRNWTPDHVVAVVYKQSQPETLNLKP